MPSSNGRLRALSLIRPLAAAGLLFALLAGAGCEETALEADFDRFILDAGPHGCVQPKNNWTVLALEEQAREGGDAGAPLANLNAIWGDVDDETGALSLFAVGSKGKVLRFDGQQWLDLSAPTAETLRSVWGTSATDVWVVGFAGTVLHYDGQAWEDRSPPAEVFLPESALPDPAAPPPARLNLSGVWVAGQQTTEALYAVGDKGLVLTLAQDVWARIPTGVEENLNGVWGTGPGSVYVVGDFGAVLTGSSTLTKVATGIPKALHKVWGRNDSDVYAIGLSGTILHNWEAVEGAPAQFLRGIWGPANDPSTTYIIGWDGTLLRMSGGPSFSSGATFEQFNCVTDHHLEGIWGTLVDGPAPDAGSAGSDAGAPRVPAIWLAGTSGTIISGP